LWGFTYYKHFKKLEVLQNRAVRVITFSKFTDHAIDIYRRLNISPLKERVILKTGIYIYKTINSLTSLYSRQYFKIRVNRVETRSSDTLQIEIPFTRLKVFENTIFVNGSKRGCP